MIVPNYAENTVYAFEYYEKIEYLGVDEDPKFCLVEYPDERDFIINKEMFISVTKNSILGWETALRLASGNDNAWNIDYEYVLIDDSENPIYTKNCDVVIEFWNAVDDYYSYSGITFIDEQLEIPKIQIAYNEVSWNEVKCDDKKYACINSTVWEPEFTGNILSEKKLIPILQHEIGHVLGLGHYLTSDSSLMDSWDRGFKKPPSLMIEVEPFVGYSEITKLDTDQVLSIYGTDGFIKSEKTVPDWVKNTMQWYLDGAISENEMISSIQFLVKEGIINLN